MLEFRTHKNEIDTGRVYKVSVKQVEKLLQLSELFLQRRVNLRHQKLQLNFSCNNLKNLATITSISVFVKFFIAEIGRPSYA
jgi:Holliday junction resolvase-like predicted endonuclease